MPQESVQALNRSIEDWFSLVRAGTLRLPRFQRHEAWDRGTVVSLLETVIRGLPAGAALVLNVGDPEPFVSRYLMTAPETGGRVTEHLLDGQQRLTALWRSLYGTYDDLSLFVAWEQDPDHPDEEIEVVSSQPRWTRNGTTYPLWCDDPVQVFERGLVPITLLAPDAHQAATKWMRHALPDDFETVLSWIDHLSALRQRIAGYNIPYLYLREGTPKHIALDVFVKMNTSNIRLTPFDIVVAQVEAAASASMHEILEAVRSEVPDAATYGDLGTLLLDVSCLLEERASSKANYLRLDFERLPEQWLELIVPLRLMVELLEGERIFDEARLPSSPILPVLVALARELPVSGDVRGNGRALLRYYMWRAFLTRRYESSSGSRTFVDYVALRDALRRGVPFTGITAPIFDESQFPLPTADALLAARWPRTRDILARGILALSLREGGRDMADDTPVTRESVINREYHHLFPDSILVNSAELSDSESYRALNCALISWQTNRQVSNRSPLDYLKDRVARADLGEAEIRERLESHLIPWSEISSAGPYTEDTAPQQIISDYTEFISSRAEIVAGRAAEVAGKGKVGPEASDGY